MIGHELAVEQGKAARPQPRRQPCQRNLRRIGAARHHALAEKGPAERHAIETADQFLAVPTFDRMGKADLVQMAIGALDRIVDPGRWPIRRGLRAQRHQPGEIAIGRDAEPLPADHLRQRMRQVKAVQRQDRAPFRLHPINVRGVAIVGHREHADGIGLQQQNGVDHRIGSSRAGAREKPVRALATRLT